MKIHILGTAAAEGWPGMFCKCMACNRARDLAGRNIRTRSSIQVDDVLKIDLPPDTYHHMLAYGLELHKLRYLLITHSHSDHCCVGEIEYINAVFREGPPAEPLHWYANRETLDRLARPQDWWWNELPVKFHEVESFQQFDMGPYKVLAIKAFHGEDAHSLNYIVSQGKCAFLYACDTGIYKEQTWEFLATHAKKVGPLPLVISECTGGPLSQEYGTHMGLPEVLEFRKKSQQIGLTNSATRWVLTHFSHNGGMVHDEFLPVAAKYGFEVAYDGMRLEV